MIWCFFFTVILILTHTAFWHNCKVMPTQWTTHKSQTNKTKLWFQGITGQSLCLNTFNLKTVTSKDAMLDLSTIVVPIMEFRSSNHLSPLYLWLTPRLWSWTSPWPSTSTRHQKYPANPSSPEPFNSRITAVHPDNARLSPRLQTRGWYKSVGACSGGNSPRNSLWKGLSGL